MKHAQIVTYHSYDRCIFHKILFRIIANHIIDILHIFNQINIFTLSLFVVRLTEVCLPITNIYIYIYINKI